MHRADFEPFGLFAIPDENGFQTTYYKNRTYDLADRLGVPRPKGITITSLDELDEIPHNFTFPIVIKPISSKIWIDNYRYEMKVRYAKNEELIWIG